MLQIVEIHAILLIYGEFCHFSLLINRKRAPESGIKASRAGAAFRRGSEEIDYRILFQSTLR
jgi:hypothetical protein